MFSIAIKTMSGEQRGYLRTIDSLTKKLTERREVNNKEIPSKEILLKLYRDLFTARRVEARIFKIVKSRGGSGSHRGPGIAYQYEEMRKLINFQSLGGILHV